MKTIRLLDWFALLLIIIGALNWGLIGFFQVDVVATLFGGEDSILTRVVYSLVGLSGIYALGFFDNVREKITEDIK